MNFLINILSTFFSKFISKSNNQINNLDTNINVNRQENTNAVAEATAAILWVCAFFLAIQYGVATYFWIKSCIAHNAIVDFPFSSKKIFEMIYSLLGLGAIGAVHKLIKRL